MTEHDGQLQEEAAVVQTPEGTQDVVPVAEQVQEAVSAPTQETVSAAEAAPAQEAPPVTADVPVQESVQTTDSDPAIDKAERVKNARRSFSRMGLGLALMGIITFGLSILASVVLSLADDTLLTENTWLAYAIQYGAMYLIGFPVLLAFTLRLPHIKGKDREKKSLGTGMFVAILCVCFLTVVIGAFASTFINNILSDAFGLDVSNLLTDAMLGMEWYTRIILAVVIAPLMEELIFRKLLIDRMRLYGERIAVITSGLMFGLFHGNLSQVVYAALLGFIFGYVYLRTGKLRYTIALHFIINGLSTLQATLLSSLDPEAMQMMLQSDIPDPEKIMSLFSPALVGIALISVLQYGLAIAGIVMFIIHIRKVHFNKAVQELPFGRRFITVWLNPGMLVFLVVVIAEFIMSYMIN